MAAFTTDARRLIQRLREGQYANADGSRIAYTDGDTLKALQDLYRVTPETNATGSSHLANDQVRAMLSDVTEGKPLSGAQLGQLQVLLKRYATELTALRRSGNADGQDYSSVPNPATGRVLQTSGKRDHHGRFVGAPRI